MPAYRVNLIVELDKGEVVSIVTDKTFYRAAVVEGSVHLFGPGVDESYDIGENIPEGLSTLHAALVAVLLWEDQV